jgi:hypothetical protein
MPNITAKRKVNMLLCSCVSCNSSQCWSNLWMNPVVCNLNSSSNLMIVAVDILSSLPNCPTSCSRVERCLERIIKLLSAKNSESPSETRILPDFASFYDFDIWFSNYSDSVVCFCSSCCYLCFNVVLFYFFFSCYFSFMGQNSSLSEIVQWCKCFPHMSKILTLAYNMASNVIIQNNIILNIIICGKHLHHCTISLREEFWPIKLFDPATSYWSACVMTGKWAVMYIVH